MAFFVYPFLRCNLYGFSPNMVHVSETERNGVFVRFFSFYHVEVKVSLPVGDQTHTSLQRSIGKDMYSIMMQLLVATDYSIYLKFSSDTTARVY